MDASRTRNFTDLFQGNFKLRYYSALATAATQADFHWSGTDATYARWLCNMTARNRHASPAK